jgi:hypothetical protein
VKAICLRAAHFVHPSVDSSLRARPERPSAGFFFPR